MKKIDFRTLLIGLLLGICVTLSMGQRAAEPQKLDADYRYQISAVSRGNGGYVIFVLDHETKKVYSRQVDDAWTGAIDVKRLTAGQ
jgi:hypothetical protein